MSFPAAAGYGSLPNGYFIPQVFTSNVLLELRRTLVADQITNTEYAGEITQQGDTVHILKEPIVAVTPYTRGGGDGTSQNLLDDRVTMVIDQANKYNFKINMIDARQSNVDLEKMAANSAAYSLQKAYDQAILSYIDSSVNATNQLGSVTVGFGAGQTTPLDLLGRMAQKLSEADCPDEDRWAVVSPQFMTWLFKEDGKYVEAQILGTDKSPVLMPTLGMAVHGFKLYKSNNLPSGKIIAGHKGAVATAQTILEAQKLVDNDDFGDKYRGLHVFGRQVLRSLCLSNAAVTYA